jgi:hypothetical protein
MTSQINISAIRTTYPVAGQDNDSQGFRDNFLAIQGALASAKEEITDLQSKVITNATLNLTDSNTFTPLPALNNLAGSTISNGVYVQFNGKFSNIGSVGITPTSGVIDPGVAPVQLFTITASTVLNFGTNGITNTWPTAGQYSSIRVMLLNSDTTQKTVTFGNIKPSAFRTEAGWSGSVSTSAPSITLPTNITHYTVIEAWTVDNGTTVFLKQIGVF